MLSKKNIPNILTIGRFLLVVPLMLSTIYGNYILAILIFTISGITDILDGIIARKFNYISDFGKLMDPLADKLTQICILAILVVKNFIPSWILIVVIVKEVALVSGASFLYGKEFVVYSKWYGKLTTILFYSAIVFSLLLAKFENFFIINNMSFLLNVDNILFYIAITLTLFSLIMYIKSFCVYNYLKSSK